MDLKNRIPIIKNSFKILIDNVSDYKPKLLTPFELEMIYCNSNYTNPVINGVKMPFLVVNEFKNSRCQ